MNCQVKLLLTWLVRPATIKAMSLLLKPQWLMMMMAMLLPVQLLLAHLATAASRINFFQSLSPDVAS